MAGALEATLLHENEGLTRSYQVEIHKNQGSPDTLETLHLLSSAYSSVANKL